MKNLELIMEKIINYIFELTVKILRFLADLLGISYQAVNVIIFCILGPAVFILMLVYIIRLRRKTRGTSPLV